MSGWSGLSGVMCRASLLALVLAACGCGTDYAWRSSVPAEVRTVAVPTFRNESDVAEIGAVASRQLLREIQREGTFKIASVDDAALEVQGVIKSAALGSTSYNRRGSTRAMAADFIAVAEISVIDRRAHKVLVNNRLYQASVSTTVMQDSSSAMRDASGRLMDELSRQVVDDLLNLKW